MSVSGTTKFGIELTGSPVLATKQNPPIDIYYWTDYQCRFCEQFEGKYLPKLVRNEVANGTARIVILQYPHYGKPPESHSMTAAVMSKCIWRELKDRNPDAFWQWHHSVFAHQGLVGGEWSSKEKLLAYAQNSKGIKVPAIEQCMQNNRNQLEADIKEERARAKKQGFNQTPGFVVYRPETDRHIQFRGAQPYFVFQRNIKNLLKQ